MTNYNKWEAYDTIEKNISVEVIADSINPYTESRATTFCIVAPRIILPELNTHRAFSRNVSSNRAKSFSNVAIAIRAMPYVPHVFQSKHKGMQGTEVLSDNKQFLARLIWKASMNMMLFSGGLLDKLGVSKQFVNRLVEPFQYISYLVTSTEWNNFFTQRDDVAAQLEIQVVARRMKQALSSSVPQILNPNQWHLPYVTVYDLSTTDALKISTARCARTSYGKPHHGPTEDINLFNNLVATKPPHLSPSEHQLKATPTLSSGNISGWYQHRKILEGIYRTNGMFNDTLYTDLVEDVGLTEL